MDIQKINWRILEDLHSDTGILNAYLTKLSHCMSIDFIPHPLSPRTNPGETMSEASSDRSNWALVQNNQALQDEVTPNP